MGHQRCFAQRSGQPTGEVAVLLLS